VGRLRTRTRKAQSEIIGAIFFIVLAMVVFTLFTTLTAAQYSLARQAAAAQQVVGYRADESLAVTLNSGSAAIRNNGPTTAAISYYMGVNAGGQATVVSLSQTIAIAPRGTVTIAVNTSFQSVGMVTSYGNVWWGSG